MNTKLFHNIKFRQLAFISISIAISLLLQIGVASIWELSENEALQAIYTIKLDFAHIQYPSLPSLIQALIMPIAENSEFLLRIPSILFALGSNILLIIMVKKLFRFDSWRLILWSIVFHNLAITTQINATFDLSISMFNILGISLILSLFTAWQKNHTWYWIISGLLSILLINTNYIALPIWILSSIYLLIELRKNSTKYNGFAIYIGISLLGLIPILIFNFKNDNALIAHFALLTQDSENIRSVFSNFIVAQLTLSSIMGVTSIFISIYMLIFYFSDLNIRFLGIHGLMISALAFLGNFFGLFDSLFTFGNILLLPLAIRWIINSRHRWVNYLKWISVGYGAVSLLIFYLTASSLIPFPAFRSPLSQLTGWKEAAFLTHQLVEKSKHQKKVLDYIFIVNKDDGARISWYTRPTPVLVLDPKASDFSIWQKNLYHNNLPNQGFFIQPDRANAELRPTKDYFDSCELYNSLSKNIAGNPVIRFHIMTCYDPKNNDKSSKNKIRS